MPGSARPLVVGVDGVDGGQPALRWAAEEALRGGLPILLVGTAEERQDAERRIDTALTTLKSAYPSVRADARELPGKLEDALFRVRRRRRQPDRELTAVWAA